MTKKRSSPAKEYVPMVTIERKWYDILLGHSKAMDGLCRLYEHRTQELRESQKETQYLRAKLAIIEAFPIKK